MEQQSFSRQLRAKITLVDGGLSSMGNEFWNHPQLPEIFPDFLFRTHCVIRASVPLMETALAKLNESPDGDPLNTELAAYFAKHIPEERRHDEWLLDDLEALGHPRSEILERIPPPTIASLAGAQYYWIAHHHPVALIGYIAVLEGNPPKVADLEAVIARSGIPREGFRTFLKHADIDPHHCADLNRALDRLPLSSRQASLIGISAMSTVQSLSRSTEEMLRLFALKASPS